jgi:amidohydrolase
MKDALLALGAVCLAACATSPAGAQAAFSAEGKSLRQIYEHLHANPELSLQEVKTSAILAAEMKRLGFTVTTRVGDAWTKARAQNEYGKLEDGVGGYGLVAVMENGPGPVLMIRADMDALPLVEKTGLPYASKARDIAWSGEEAGVMHACGHDVHMTTWIGTARELAAHKSEWRGTLVMIAQPAEEIGLGAMAMLNDGLFTRFPKPDHVIALHDHASLPAGVMGIGSGYVMANVDSIDLTITGKGGHGAYPQDTRDPIVVAARIVTTIQTLVSREIDPLDSAVVTVGAFNGGFKHNIIPDEVKLQLTVRSFADATRDKLLTGIERIARAEALAAGLDPQAAISFNVKADHTPSLYNEPELATRLGGVLRTILGEANVTTATPSMAGEDFARYGRTTEDIPVMLLWLGAVKREAWEAAQKPGGKPLPSLHSSEYAPDPDPTLAAGVKAMTASAMELLK